LRDNYLRPLTVSFHAINTVVSISSYCW
jgi:hypothetical protein